MFSRIGTVQIYVEDIDRCLAFYRDVLGFRERFREGEVIGLETIGPILCLHRGGKASDRPKLYDRTSMKVDFLVDDLDATMTELRSRGVEFTSEIQDKRFGRLVTFCDPEGNVLQLFEVRDPFFAPRY
jgi:predicted enzyme related to lactoylglutathione lyase